ncbi:MAG: ATP-binding protein [Anaerolineae bacterium]|nr:ATP-binding protein [Anaerolineae bacterium]
MCFVDRERELLALQEMWEQERAQFLILCGRRRIGKTALLLHFARHRPYLYWVASRLSSETLLRSFSRTVHNYARPQSPAGPDFTYGDWATAFGQLGALTQEQRLLVVVDEFPYAVEAEPGLPSIIQNV